MNVPGSRSFEIYEAGVVIIVKKIQKRLRKPSCGSVKRTTELLILQVSCPSLFFGPLFFNRKRRSFWPEHGGGSTVVLVYCIAVQGRLSFLFQEVALYLGRLFR